MPTLPLPSSSGIKAILMHRAKQDLLGDAAENFNLSTGTKKSRDIFEFEYEPLEDHYRQRTPEQFSCKEHFSNEKEFLIDEQEASTSQEHFSNEKILSNHFSIITKGHGYLAINATVDSVEYTGMLYSHNNNGMPGILTEEDRENFLMLCRYNKPNTPIDQWSSILVDRQLLPGRHGRCTKTNWARKNGRMICYSCLCVVPEEKSMPFACNCRDRQRQRASRLKCGGYQPSRDRLVVVAQLDNSGVHNTSVNSGHVTGQHHLSTRNCVAEQSHGVVSSMERCNEKKDDLSLVCDKASKLKKLSKTSTLSTNKSAIQKRKDKSIVGRRGRGRSGSVLCVSVAPPISDSEKVSPPHSMPILSVSESSSKVDALLDLSDKIKNSRININKNTEISSQNFSTFSREKLAEFSKPMTCIIPDQIQFTTSAPNSNALKWESKRTLRSTFSAPSSRKSSKVLANEKCHNLVTSTTSWNNVSYNNNSGSGVNHSGEERSRYSERILLERAMRESLEIAKAEKPALLTTPVSSRVTKTMRKSLTPITSKLEMIEEMSCENRAQCIDPQKDENSISDIPSCTPEKKRKIDSATESFASSDLIAPKLDALECANDVLKGNLFESTPQYVIRNNSPLQMTILKVGAVNALLSSTSQIPPPPKLEKQHHHRHHHHHHHHRHRRDREDDKQQHSFNTENDSNDETMNLSDKAPFLESDQNGFHSGVLVENDNERVRKRRSLSMKSDSCKSDSKGLKNSMPNDYVLRSRTRNRSIIAAALTDEDLCELKKDLALQNTTISTRPIKDKRTSLEARILTIKERLMSGVLPMKPVSANVFKKSIKSITPISANSPSKQSIKSEKNNNDLLPCFSFSQNSTVLTTSFCPSTIVSPHLSSAVLSRVSALIRAEIYRSKTLIESEEEPRFSHGIVCGSLVWARAPLSSYWPGLVIAVAAKTVKVAWCGERTYNEVDVAMINDFMDSFTTRFNPVSKEHRNNKKFCNAVAETIALAHPPLAELDRKLNIVVAKLLITKFHWNLDGLTVYQASKLIVINSSSGVVGDIISSNLDENFSRDVDFPTNNSETFSATGSDSNETATTESTVSEHVLLESMTKLEQTQLGMETTENDTTEIENNKMEENDPETEIKDSL